RRPARRRPGRPYTADAEVLARRRNEPMGGRGSVGRAPHSGVGRGLDAVGFDVIVVGAGPAGCASASLLADRGRRVLLLDAARFPRAKACAEYISPGGAAILERLGALQAIEATGQRRWLRGMRIQAPGGARHLVGYV